MLGFTNRIFRLIGKLHRRLTEQHAELAAQHEAGLAIMAELDLGLVLQRVIDQARRLAGARYGLLILQEEHGLRTLLTSGYPISEACTITETTTHGILDLVLHQGQTLWIEDLQSYPGQ